MTDHPISAGLTGRATVLGSAPMGESGLENTTLFPDAPCLAAAPHLGDVVTVAKPLVSYRVHGRNDGAMLTLNADRLARELRRASGAEIPSEAKEYGVTLLTDPEGRFVFRHLPAGPWRLKLWQPPYQEVQAQTGETVRIVVPPP